MNNTSYSNKSGGALRSQRLGDSKGFGGEIGLGSSGLNSFSFNANPASLKGKI